MLDEELRARVAAEVAKVVVGASGTVDVLLAASVLGGHVLLEGAPGTAKTLVANAFARALGLDFRRIQFTPDMLPSDVTGTMALRAGELAFRPGPVFTSVLLADEINRTPPKTQAALLEAMQERRSPSRASATAAEPFLVIATQNPIEQEGTYPLPEAQLDRFLIKLDVGYPSVEDETAMLRLPRSGIASSPLDAIAPVADAGALAAARADLEAVAATDEVLAYAVAIVRATRALPSVELGASPRAAVHLVGAARARALLDGRAYVSPDDVVGVAPAVLAHRVLLRPEAELERFRPVDAVLAAIQTVPVPR